MSFKACCFFSARSAAFFSRAWLQRSHHDCFAGRGISSSFARRSFSSSAFCAFSSAFLFASAIFRSAACCSCSASWAFFSSASFFSTACASCSLWSASLRALIQASFSRAVRSWAAASSAAFRSRSCRLSSRAESFGAGSAGAGAGAGAFTAGGVALAAGGTGAGAGAGAGFATGSGTALARAEKICSASVSEDGSWRFSSSSRTVVRVISRALAKCAERGSYSSGRSTRCSCAYAKRAFCTAADISATGVTAGFGFAGAAAGFGAGAVFSGGARTRPRSGGSSPAGTSAPAAWAIT